MIGIGDLALRLGVAALCGLVVGLERERRERAAGMRTMALVCLGSALFTLISAYAFSDLVKAQHIQLDPTRIMAQIVTGIGFLGAGTIWLRRDTVRGLTTAAALWVVAAIGMACGAGLWAMVVIGIAGTLVVLAVLHPIERWIFPEHGPHTLRVQMGSVAEAGAAVARVHAICTQTGLEVETLEVHEGKQGGEEIEVRCRATRIDQLTKATQELRAIPGAQGVRMNVREDRPLGTK